MPTTTQNPAPKPETSAGPDCALPTGSQLGCVIVFALYSIAYEAIVWGLFGWAVFWQDRSGWWVVIALMLSGAQLKPKHFGIRTGDTSANTGSQP